MPAPRGPAARLITLLHRVLAPALAALALAAPAWAEGDAIDLPNSVTKVEELGAKVFYLHDPEGSLTLEDVMSQAVATRFARTEGRYPNFGFTRNWIWLRFTVQSPPGPDRAWFLEIDYPPLDVIEVHAPMRDTNGDMRYEVRKGGDLLPYAAREIQSNNYLFALDLPSGSVQTIYLRVRSESSVTVPLRLLSRSGLESARWSESFLLALFFGALLALGIFNLLLWFTLRNCSYLYYVTFVGMTAMAYSCYNGLAYQYFWPESPVWNNRAPMFFGFLTIATGALFGRSFLRVWEHGRRYDIPAMAIIGLSLLLAAATISPMPYWVSARCFPFIAIAGSVNLIVNSIQAIRRGYRPARVFLLAWAALIAGLVAFALRALEILPGNFFTIYGVQIGSLVEALLLSQALAQRIHTMREEKEAAQMAALQAKESALQVKEQALEASRLAEHDLESMVAERVQELARVNRTLEAEIFERKRAEELLRRLAYHDALTGLPNRTLLKDRFNMAVSAAKRNETNVALLVIDLDNFKDVNEEHGHDVGDDLLVSFARILQTRLREMDTIARLGGDEFVVLVNDLACPREAARVAEKVLSILNEPIRVTANQSVRVSASIGIAVYGDDGTEVDPLLKRAEASMYAAKKAGRGIYRFATIPAGA
ncbi:MAG: diguanylate cyclase [Burkholderiales bacterium]|nr:diguanylate cyclase [Burkholderiales bacterium]